MKRIFVIATMILATFSLSAQIKHKIAVLDYEDRSKQIEIDTLSTATDYLRMYLEGQNNFELIPKEQQNNTSCKDKLCRIKLGETLKAEIVVYPYISSANNQYVINVELINVAKRSKTISVSKDWNGESDSLDSVSEALVRQIAAKQKNLDALNANNSFRENIPEKEPTFAENFKIAYNTIRDTQACEKARKKESIKEWNNYLKVFPEGQCVDEAKKFIEEYPKKLDAEACEKARKKEDIKDWNDYLKNFPEGQCVDEAKKFIEDYLQKIDAVACEKAKKENSKKGWQEYLKRYPQGQCTEEANAAPDNFACSEAEKGNNKNGWEKYLKQYPQGRCAQKAKQFLEEYLKKIDAVACEKARKENSKKGWQEYLKRYPQGQCAEEANAAPDNFACSEAEKDNDKNGWEKYLKQYPQGRCAQKARTFIEHEKQDTEACKLMREKNKKDAWQKNYWGILKDWQEYLKQYPQGQCAKEATAILEKRDGEACKLMRKKNIKNAWQTYLEKFPNGQCTQEAKEFIKNN